MSLFSTIHILYCRALLLIAVALFSTGSNGQILAQAIPADTNILQAYPSPQNTYLQLEKDSKLQYGNYKTTAAPSLLERFEYWLTSLLRDIFGERVFSKIRTWQYWIMAGIGAGVALYLLYMFSKKSIVVKKSSKHLEYVELSENIHDIDFDDAIRRLLTAGDYRRAIRFHFLQLLKVLSDRELIVWKPSKTNRDYQKELTAHSISREFSLILRLYETTWYGEHLPSQHEYKEIEASFLHISQLDDLQ